MSAIERVTSAYARKYQLSPGQSAFARAEISKIVDDLKKLPRRVRSAPETPAGPNFHADGARVVNGAD